MQHRRRRTAVGLVLIALVSGAAWLVVTAASAESPVATSASAPPARPAAAAVGADGTPTGPPVDWTVTHEIEGLYIVSLPRPARLDLRSWSAAADATVRPISDRLWSVSFVAGRDPVDTAFSFVLEPPDR